MSLGDAIRDQAERTRRRRRRKAPSNGVLISEILGPEDGPYDMPAGYWNPDVWQPPR